MNRRERVKRAITYNKPDRVPKFKIPFGDTSFLFNIPQYNWQPTEKNVYPYFMSDIIRKLRLYRWRRPAWAHKNWFAIEREEIDEWGCYWNKMAYDITMGHPGRPAIETWDQLDSWQVPDLSDPQPYKIASWLTKLLPGRYKVAIPNNFHFIAGRVSMLRGFSNILIDHYRNPKQVHELTKKVTEVFLKHAEMLITHYKPDAFFGADDLGTQHQLFFSPAIFKKFYAEPYKKVINFVHDHGCDFILHSCGNVGELIPIFIDLGVDALEFDSPRMTGYETLLKFRGKIPFWACVNIQSVYPFGTPEKVEQEVKKMIETFSTHEGGYLAYYYADLQVLNVPKRNVRAFDKGLKKWGKYPLKWLS